MLIQKRWTLLLALVLVVALGTFASAEVVITFYNANPAGSGLTNLQQTLMEEFQEANPGIRVEHVYNSSYDAAMEKALVAWAAGMAPNVIILEQSRWFTWALEQYIAPVTDYIADDESIWLEDFYPGMVEALTWDGEVWGIPHQISIPVMYQNKTLFREAGLNDAAPTTWDELRTAARRITRDTDSENATWGFAFTGWGWLFDAWIGQNGARMASSDGRRYTFDSEEAIAAMEWVQSFVLEDGTAYGGNPGTFYTGGLAMYYGTSGQIENVTNRAIEVGFDVGVAPMACGIECFAPIGGGNLYMMNTGTQEERDAAWALISYMSSTENLARLTAETGFMGARRSTIESQQLMDHFYDNPFKAIPFEQLSVARPRVRVPGHIQSGPYTTTIGNQLWEGANVRAVLTEAARQSNQLLDEWWADFEARRNK